MTSIGASGSIQSYTAHIIRPNETEFITTIGRYNRSQGWSTRLDKIKEPSPLLSPWWCNRPSTLLRPVGRPARRHRAAPLVQYEVAEPLPYQQGLFVCAGEWLALGVGKTPFQRANHCSLLRAIRGWPVDSEGAAPTHFARPDLATASTTGGSQRLSGEGRQPGTGKVFGGVAISLCQSNLVPTITASRRR